VFGSAQRWAIVAVVAALLTGGAMIGSLGGASAADVEAADPGSAAVAGFDGLDAIVAGQLPRRRSPAAVRAEVAPLVAPEECLRVTGETSPFVLRYAGADRYETAVCASFWTWFPHNDPGPEVLKAQAVVLARGDAFPDALAGGPLAGHAEGPLLLTRPTELLPGVLDEIRRVLAPGGRVYLLGGTSALSTGIRSQLNAAGYDTVRLSGANRFETAIAVANELPDTNNFFFVTGRNFPDALAAGTAAAGLSRSAKLDDLPETLPVGLLLTDDDAMPVSTAEFVAARETQFGGLSLASAGGAADRAVVAAFGEDSLVRRFVGSSRYETAALIAEDIYTDDLGELVGFGAGLATGLRFPDALAATANLAPFAEPLLLTPSTQLSAPSRAFLQDHAGDVVPDAFLDVFGGGSSVSSTVASQARTAFTP
jgi:hypothetical protein